MSRIAFNRNKMRLQRVIGIRARLVVLALILVGPLMFDRARVLEQFRQSQVTRANEDFTRLAETSADAQSELMLSVEAVLRASAYIYSASAPTAQGCTILRASLRRDMPWIKSLSIAAKDGAVVCSTADDMLTLNLGDRSYFRDAVATQGFTVSNYMLSRRDNKPVVMTAFPVSSVTADRDAVVVAAVNLDWMSRIMKNLGGHPGIAAVMIDSTGIVVAAPPDQSERIGRPLDDDARQTAMSVRLRGPGRQSAPVFFTGRDGSRRAVSVAEVAGTTGRLVIEIDETAIAGSANEAIRNAYIQLALVCLVVLVGALFAAERLIVRPIRVLEIIARRFGRGDWTARAGRDGLPAEFVPLAHAFDEMATQLGQRERDMAAANDRLTVMASIDALTGLANRRGFQSRLDFEWMKAIQTGERLALLMIDVDHFKAFNDSYGHPEGDSCLARFGETLGTIAHDANGFAARYGGEEFCLLLPRADTEQAMQVGEQVRAAIQALAIPHATTAIQRVTTSIGLASATPNETQTSKDLIEAADAALYAAKHRGRNTVVCHGFARGGTAELAKAG